MGSFLVSASLRRVYEPEDTPAAAPALPPAPTEAPSHMLEPPHPTATRLLPFDLLLLKGSGTVTLFPTGTVDELTFLQRTVSSEHELEYLISADPAQDEGFSAYGVFRLEAEGEPLVDFARQGDLWQRLRERHGIVSLPPARDVIAQTADTYDISTVDWSGRNTVKARYGYSYRADGQRKLSHWRVLEVLRESCRPRQLIAWIESAMGHPPPGTREHRYYIDARSNVYLVRARGRTRRLFVPRRCESGEVPVPWRRFPVPEAGRSLGAVSRRPPRPRRARPRPSPKRRSLDPRPHMRRPQD